MSFHVLPFEEESKYIFVRSRDIAIGQSNQNIVAICKFKHRCMENQLDIVSWYVVRSLFF